MKALASLVFILSLIWIVGFIALKFLEAQHPYLAFVLALALCTATWKQTDSGKNDNDTSEML